MTIVVIGKPGGNLSEAKGGLMAAGAKGEERLAKKLKEWVIRRGEEETFLVAFSFSSDGRGDIDSCIATMKGKKLCVMLLDAKNFKPGYTYGLTKEHKIRRTESTKTPKGRPFTKTGAEIHSEQQIARLKRELGKYGLKHVVFSKPAVVLCPAIPGSINVAKDENWKSSPFTLVSIDEVDELLDWTFRDVKGAAGKPLYYFGKFVEERLLQ